METLPSSWAALWAFALEHGGMAREAWPGDAVAAGDAVDGRQMVGVEAVLRAQDRATARARENAPG